MSNLNLNPKWPQLIGDLLCSYAKNLAKYLALPRIKRNEDPIQWWHTVGRVQFPMLFLGAQKYLCMTATSVPSERVFSRAGNVITKKRASLGTQMVNEIVTLSHNME